MDHDPCCLCGGPCKMDPHLIVAPGGVVRASVPLCATHGAAVALGYWTLTVTAMDMVRHVSGHKLPLGQQGF